MHAIRHEAMMRAVGASSNVLKCTLTRRFSTSDIVLGHCRVAGGQQASAHPAAPPEGTLPQAWPSSGPSSLPPAQSRSAPATAAHHQAEAAPPPAPDDIRAQRKAPSWLKYTAYAAAQPELKVTQALLPGEPAEHGHSATAFQQWDSQSSWKPAAVPDMPAAAAPVMAAAEPVVVSDSSPEREAAPEEGADEMQGAGGAHRGCSFQE